MRYELTDYEWAAIKPMLPNKPRGASYWCSSAEQGRLPGQGIGRHAGAFRAPLHITQAVRRRIRRPSGSSLFPRLALFAGDLIVDPVLDANVRSSRSCPSVDFSRSPKLTFELSRSNCKCHLAHLTRPPTSLVAANEAIGLLCRLLRCA
jgi:hypothetical protein